MTESEDNDRTEDALRQLSKTPRQKRIEGYVWLFVGIVLGGMMFGMLTLDKRITAANQKIDTNVTIIDQQALWLNQQRLQFEKCTGAQGTNNPKCIKPVVPSVTLTPQRVEQSVDSSKSLTESQVQAIATTVVANSSWSPSLEQTNQIARIAFGLIPKQPTTQQINNMLTVTVATYCAHDKCKGKDAPTITPAPGRDGTPGANGTPGADSTVPGPRGQDATDEQIAAGVAAYCSANNDCKGPVGRGIASLTCQDDGTLLAVYDKPDADGKTQQVIPNSDCKVQPAPTVTETTTVTAPPDSPTSAPLIKVGKGN